MGRRPEQTIEEEQDTLNEFDRQERELLQQLDAADESKEYWKRESLHTKLNDVQISREEYLKSGRVDSDNDSYSDYGTNNPGPGPGPGNDGDSTYGGSE